MSTLHKPETEARPSQVRAWLALVSGFQRQARARQMVWIALGLLVFAVIGTALNTSFGRWGMHHQRFPRRFGPTYAEWVERIHIVTAVVHRSPGAHGIQHAVLGSTRVILDPNARNTAGEVVAVSGFQVFSQWVVFTIFLTFLLPLWSLSFATEALGGERESQSLVWLLTRPIPRPAIYLGKFVALLPWSLGFNLVGFVLLCLAAGPAGRPALRYFWPAVLWASLAFSALFFLIGATFRRPAVVAIIYSLCLEVVLGVMPGYLNRASIGFYTQCIMHERMSDLGIEPIGASAYPIEAATARVVLIAATIFLLALGAWIFSRSQYHEVD